MKKLLLALLSAAVLAASVLTATAGAGTTTQACPTYSGVGGGTLGPITLTDTAVLYWRSDGTSFELYNVDRSNPNGEVGRTSDGSGATILPAGTYTLRVVTDGSWTFTVSGSDCSTPGSSATAATPAAASSSTFSGSGNGVIGPITFPTTTVLYWESNGTSFQLKNDDRSNANGEVGLTSAGYGATIVPAGTYTLDVASDGDWTITANPQ
jgi:hypothetical protein